MTPTVKHKNNNSARTTDKYCSLCFIFITYSIPDLCETCYNETIMFNITIHGAASESKRECKFTKQDVELG
ncbi:hypothetical protein C270_05100 [Leuconostoc carnosum JB16]|uniref:Uncharacterized protein n=1 Tax=Leuconostoc carnosum (strain JB16) TaxID=1229758 RepID=K0DD41_LEUCJ|nr:hypothetical protein C270_05100 [Leuconostoc carnosum JB16]